MHHIPRASAWYDWLARGGAVALVCMPEFRAVVAFCTDA